MHISELAQHHVENPREIIQPGDDVKVKILEIDSERRRLSLSIKRVEGQVLPQRDTMAPTETSDGGAGDLENVPELGLSEDVFSNAPEAEAPVDEVEAPAAEAEAEVEEAPAEDEPAAPDAAVEEAASEEAPEEQP